MKSVVSRDELVSQLVALGVRPGSVLLVHTAFRSVRPVEDGPAGLIEALRAALGPDGTLVMPTMTDGETPFDPARTPTLDMGAVAEMFWRQQGVLRSTHPGGSFAAHGLHAEFITSPQPLSPPHGIESPPGRVHALDGAVLLLGVTYSACTMLHVAESVAKVPYSIEYPTCVTRDDGHIETVMIAETDHCCRNFEKMHAWMNARGLQREGTVGHAHATLARARDIVSVAREHLVREPLVFLCAAGTCEACDTARASMTD